MAKNIIKNDSKKREITLDGLMTIGKLEDGRTTGEFMNCENARIEPFRGDFRVQGMRDGNVYLTQKPKRIKNTPIFRDDNSSLSQGRDGRWYFYFSLDEDRIGELPEQLVRQASAIAQKVLRELICNQ
jgi:hypothetical protein